MKKIGVVLLLLTTFLFTGCLDDDGYSLSDMWVGFGILHKNGPGDYEIIMDNDDVLVPVTAHHGHYYDSDHSPFQDGDRVLVNYTVLGDNAEDENEPTEYYIKINSIREILMKGILDITEENADSIGNDPVILQDAWITDSLLNVKIRYWGNYKTHYINLVKEPGELTAADQPIALELRHNSRDDQENVPYSAYVSFNLNAIKISGLDSVQFVVTCTDYDGNELDYEGVFHYGEGN